MTKIDRPVPAVGHGGLGRACATGGSLLESEFVGKHLPERFLSRNAQAGWAGEREVPTAEANVPVAELSVADPPLDPRHLTLLCYLDPHPRADVSRDRLTALLISATRSNRGTGHFNR